MGALLQLLPTIVQFVSADFFFFSGVDAADSMSDQATLFEMVNASQFAIRIDDNTTVVVMTRSLDLVCELLKSDRPLLLEKGDLAAMFARRQPRLPGSL